MDRRGRLLIDQELALDLAGLATEDSERHRGNVLLLCLVAFVVMRKRRLRGISIKNDGSAVNLTFATNYRIPFHLYFMLPSGRSLIYSCRSKKRQEGSRFKLALTVLVLLWLLPHSASFGWMNLPVICGLKWHFWRVCCWLRLSLPYCGYLGATAA